MPPKRARVEKHITSSEDEESSSEPEYEATTQGNLTIKKTDNEILIEDYDEDNFGAESKKTNVDGNTDEGDGVTFEDLGLCPELCLATKELGWVTPSIIQKQTLPIAFKNRDIIGLAETGSGKTGAFALPIIQALLEEPSPHFALILAPTRELAFQIAETFENLGARISLRVVTVVGGVSEFDQARALAGSPHIIVATPGRIVYHLENTKGFHLKRLKYLVLDEADRLLNMDFEKDINRVLEVIPRERRSFLFSATMTSKVNKLQRASLVDPIKIEVSKKYQTAKNLVQQFIFCPAKFKELYLVYLLTELAGNRTIIFTSTCENSQRLAIILRTLGMGAIPLHGKLSQQHRLAALNKFKEGGRSILIATDVASRGLDIPSVDLVVNFAVPNNSKDYIHRVGRTARAGRSGRAVTIVTQYDVELFQRIEHLLGYKLDQHQIDKNNVMLLLERVNEAARIAAIELKEAEQQGQGLYSGGAKKKKKVVKRQRR